MRMLKPALLIALLAVSGGAFAAGGHGGEGAPWSNWHAANSTTSTPSLQRGAANFAGYCQGCHSLKYMRYSRMAEDLGIPADQLDKLLLPAGHKATDYIMSTMPPADAEAWFGKAPPDLSLMVRARGADYVYQFLKGFYLDPAKPTGVDNVRLAGTAMPHVLSELEGVKHIVFKASEHHEGSAAPAEKVFDRFELVSPGHLKPEEYDEFVRDTVNFLDYVSEPAQNKRRALGVWVVLFLLVFTWFAWLLKKEYWKEVH